MIYASIKQIRSLIGTMNKLVGGILQCLIILSDSPLLHETKLDWSLINCGLSQYNLLMWGIIKRFGRRSRTSQLLQHYWCMIQRKECKKKSACVNPTIHQVIWFCNSCMGLVLKYRAEESGRVKEVIWWSEEGGHAIICGWTHKASLYNLPKQKHRVFDVSHKYVHKLSRDVSC